MSKPPQEIRELFDAYLDSEVSPSDLQRLEAWIGADSANADEFLSWMSLQTATYEALKGDLLEQVMAESASRIDFPASAILKVRGDGAAGRVAERFLKPWAWLLAGAAAILVAGWLLPGKHVEDLADQGNEVDAASAVEVKVAKSDESNGALELAPVGNSVAATLTGFDGCVWTDLNCDLDYGHQLSEGARVALSAGIARITFESGAVATLEGPCDFVVDNAMHGTIRSGRVSVTAPKRAYGFRIRSPNAEVIDLGTTFGVAVDDRGNSEVHVFSGEVLSRRIDAAGDRPGKLFRLTENNALKFATPQRRPSKMASDTTMFPGQVQTSMKSESDQALPVGDHLALWLAADLSAKTTDGRRVFAWSDILFGDNISAEDAFQSKRSEQPILAPRGLNGKPAVRFDGASAYLVTTPLETTDNQTIFIACQFSKAALRPGRTRGGQLLNYNGPPHRLVSSTYEPGVLQIGEPIVDGFAPTRLGGKLFAGRIDGRDVSESEIHSSPIGADVPVILAYRYDLTRHTASLWINGELIEEKAALRPAGVISRKVIGRHGFMKFFFAGDIGELLIYNAALSPAKMKQVSDYLNEKYDIPLAATPASL